MTTTGESAEPSGEYGLITRAYVRARARAKPRARACACARGACVRARRARAARACACEPRGPVRLMVASMQTAILVMPRCEQDAIPGKVEQPTRVSTDLIARARVHAREPQVCVCVRACVRVCVTEWSCPTQTTICAVLEQDAIPRNEREQQSHWVSMGLTCACAQVCACVCDRE
jgi:hypothetical protein